MDVLITEDLEAPGVRNLGERLQLRRKPTLWKSPEVLSLTLAGAPLDVLETEPPAGENRFRPFDNMILAPHIASFTAEAQPRAFKTVCADLERVRRGEAAVNRWLLRGQEVI